MEPEVTPEDRDYYPLVDTLRLYAGWLLGFLIVIYAVGGMQMTRVLPVRAPLLDEWMRSPSIRAVAAITFLFLFLSTIHRLLNGGIWKAIGLTILGFVLLAGFMTYS